MYIRFNSNSCKTVLVYLISFFLIYTPTLTHAATVGGWSLGTPIAQGASAIVNGTKKVVIDGKDYVKKGTALITPTASQVAKVLRRGGAAYALSFAVEQLIGGLEWILDAENNQIVYKEKNKINVPMVWIHTSEPTKFYSSAQEACRSRLPNTDRSKWRYSKTVIKSGGKDAECWGYMPNSDIEIMTTGVLLVKNPNYTEEAEDETKTIPLDVVAAKVISNAESENEDAKVATAAAAADIVAEAEKDDAKARPIVNQLEQSATTENADADAQANSNTSTGEATKNPAKPDTTDLKLEFPAFCGWAPVVCEAAQVVISFPNKIETWYKDSTKAISDAWISVKDWAKSEEPTKDQEKPEIKDPDLSIGVTNYIQFGSQCPVDRQIPLSMGGQTLNLVISYQPLCTVAQQFRPAVILMAFLAGAFIITNTGRRAETGD